MSQASLLLRNSGFDALEELLIRHEGIRIHPYQDTVGKLTIGVGRNLDDVGLSKSEIMFMLRNDVMRAWSSAQGDYPWFVELDPIRQDVILNMIFNLGEGGFAGFKKLIKALDEKNFELAAKEMLDSKWATQVGLRAKELAVMMITGKYGSDLEQTLP